MFPDFVNEFINDHPDLVFWGGIAILAFVVFAALAYDENEFGE